MTLKTMIGGGKMSNHRLMYLCGMLPRATAPTILGGIGEQIVQEHLQIQGYQTRKLKPDNQGDLIVFDNHGVGLHVEVKTARFAPKCNQWQWLLQKSDKYGKTSIWDSEMVVFLQVNKITFDTYVVPSRFFPKNQKRFSIRTPANRYNGKLKPFKQDIRKLDLWTSPNEILTIKNSVM